MSRTLRYAHECVAVDAYCLHDRLSSFQREWLERVWCWCLDVHSILYLPQGNDEFIPRLLYGGPGTISDHLRFWVSLRYVLNLVWLWCNFEELVLCGFWVLRWWDITVFRLVWCRFAGFCWPVDIGILVCHPKTKWGGAQKIMLLFRAETHLVYRKIMSTVPIFGLFNFLFFYLEWRYCT